MSDWSFTVPSQPPSVNHMYGRNPTGKRYKATGVESYQVGAAMIVRQARPAGWEPARRIHMVYRMWLRTGGMDASNHLKALEDAIAAALGVNDNTFLPCVASKEVDKRNPRVEVTIRNAVDP